MRLLLLRTPIRNRRQLSDLSSTSRRYPLPLAYLAGGLKEWGLTVNFLDCARLGHDYHSGAGAVFDSHPDIVYAEPVPGEARCQLQFLNSIKELSSIRVVLGGAFVSLFPAKVLEALPEADALVVGEPEQTLRELTERWQNGLSALRVPGVITPGSKRPHAGPERASLAELDLLPFPDRELVPLRFYQGGWIRRRPFALVAGTRGCPRRCRFCARGRKGGRVRYRTPANIACEVEELVRRWGVREIGFVDPVLNSDYHWSLELAEALAPLSILWHATCTASGLDRNLLRAFRRSGCRDLFFGPVCPTEKSSRELQVSEDPEAVRRAITLAREEDITAHTKIITGEGELPTFQEAKGFASLLNGSSVAIRQVHPQPGSELSPDPSSEFPEPQENRELRYWSGFSIREAQYWRDRIQTFLKRPKRVTCTETELGRF